MNEEVKHIIMESDEPSSKLKVTKSVKSVDGKITIDHLSFKKMADPLWNSHDFDG